jgi:uncharacterized membrane protein YsdA (DUF1294 family)
MALHWCLTAIVTVLGTVALAHYLDLDVVICYLVAVNAVTTLTYLYDKAIAGSSRSRIPERLLLTLAFVGGSIGALVGMQAFRHKTAKSSFQVRFWLVVVAQIALVALYFLWLQPWLRSR